MNVKLTIICGVCAAALLSAGCTGIPRNEPDGKGRVAFGCEVSGEVGVTRSDVKSLPADLVPAADELGLVISNDSGVVVSYETLADYNQPLLDEGSYTASFSYGNPDVEGAGKACFAGEETFTIVARKTLAEPVSVSLANSVFTLGFSEWFRKYYSEYTINVRTESGFQVGFVGSGSKPLLETVPVFVKAGTALFMDGTATKTNGAEVSFPETRLGVTAARTWHSININAGQASQAGIVVSLDDTPVAIEEVPVELNPDA